MNVIALVLALCQRQSASLNLSPEAEESILASFEADVSETTELAKALFERRAGFENGLTGKCDANRLRDPRLRTTAPLERQLALVKRTTDWRDRLAELLPQTLELSMKLEFAELELTEERRRELKLRDAQHARETLVIYVEAIATINRLYNDYGVTRRHHATLTSEQYRDIAAIILREEPHTIPVVELNRRRHGERNDG